jgi:phosphoglycolate phosphatase
MTLRKPELVMFDLDGTLVDTAPDLAWSIDFTLEQLNLPARGEDKVRAWIGSGIEGVMKRALTNNFNGQPDATLLEQALSIFMQSYYDNIHVRGSIYPGVLEVLNYLQTNDFKIACVTNKGSRFTNKLLTELELIETFGLIVSGDTLPVKKPEPEPLLHTTAHFQVSTDAALMVGDSITDINAARAAGIQVLGVSYGYNKGQDIRLMDVDAVVDNIVDLTTLI